VNSSSKSTDRCLASPRRVRCPGGFSLVEALVVMTIMGILISMSVPSFRRAMEQSRADIAGANLQAIWAAERLYWLSFHRYTADLTELKELSLLDPALVSASTVYVYAATGADDSSFTATATRSGSGIWTGELSIDQTGTVQGAVEGADQTIIQPGFQ
jgi:prepilin-type N-terminal cleavage/methylation domain-containing protein